jgi:mono/diheme cytochrome c family protein
MKKVIKWIAILLGSLIGIAVTTAIFMIISTTRKFNKTYQISAEDLSISSDEESLAIGEHWVEIHCRDCHAEDLGGSSFFDDPTIGFVDAPNLTSGKGGIGSNYSDEDWVLALRHGLNGDGTSVFIMPSNDFYYINDTDLAGIIAYMKTVPAVDRETRPRSFSVVGKIMYAIGAFGDLLYAGTIQHDIRPESPKVGITLEYGEYLVNANGCRPCHGETLAGKQPSEPGAPFAPNLTPGGLLSTWSEEEFITTMRTGVNPYNYKLSDSMPWQGLGKMTDDELKTVWLYLQSLLPLKYSQD